MKLVLLICMFFSFATFTRSQEEGRYSVAGINNDSIFIKFYNEFKSAITQNDSNKIADFILLPNTFFYGKNEKIIIKNKKSFCANYSKLFDKKLKNLIIETSGDSLFANSEGIMLDNGQIWFNAIMVNKKFILKVFTIQNVNDLYNKNSLSH